MTGRDSRAPRRTADFSRVSLNEVMRPAHSNLHGGVHGGEILKLADTCAGIVSARHCGGKTMTRAITSASFDAPIEIGSLVHATGTVVGTGRTSVTVEVVVEKEPIHSAQPERRVPVARMVFVMVHVGDEGRPSPVPELD